MLDITSIENVSSDRKLVSNIVTWRFLTRSQEVVIWASLTFSQRKALSVLEHILSALAAKSKGSEPWLLPWILPIWDLDREGGLVPLVIYRAVRVSGQSVWNLTQERVFGVSLVEPKGCRTVAVRVFVLLLTSAVLVWHLHLIILVKISAIIEILIQKQSLKNRRKLRMLYNINLLVELWLILLIFLKLLLLLLQ